MTRPRLFLALGLVTAALAALRIVFAFQASAKLEPKDELSAQLAKNLAMPPDPAAKP